MKTSTPCTQRGLEADFLAGAKNDTQLQENMKDRLSLLDINSDNAISSTEMEEMIKGVDMIASYDETDKQKTSDNVKESFKSADSFLYLP